jgi:NTE family protein
MRTGLVLGAGGVIGASWLVGALEALESETGWSPSSADVVVGTSAGSVIGALTAQGIPPALMAAYIGGGSLDEFAELEGREDLVTSRLSGTDFRLHKALPPIGPGSIGMAVRTLLNPGRHAPSAVLSGWLPRGFISTAPITDLVGQFVEADWPDHPNYWAVACDYGNGKRVPFGRDGAPPARVGDAVAASCAIPGFYHPVKIGGRRYVDGGVCSVSNLDLVADQELDLVVCLNPMTSLAEITCRTPGERVAAAMRRQAGRRLGHEAKKLRERGTEVLILQPVAEDLTVMGTNFMARDRREAVIERAVRTTARQLRRRRTRPGTVFPPRTRRTAARRPAVTRKAAATVREAAA